MQTRPPGARKGRPSDWRPSKLSESIDPELSHLLLRVTDPKYMKNFRLEKKEAARPKVRPSLLFSSPWIYSTLFSHSGFIHLLFSSLLILSSPLSLTLALLICSHPVL